MRTTLSLDEDLAERLADLARESKMPFKVVVNDILRRGMSASGSQEAEFRLQPHAGHLQPGIDDRRLNELAWELDEKRGA